MRVKKLKKPMMSFDKMRFCLLVAEREAAAGLKERPQGTRREHSGAHGEE